MVAISRKIKVIDWIKNSPRLAWIDLQQPEESEQPKQTAENLMANDLKCPEQYLHAMQPRNNPNLV